MEARTNEGSLGSLDLVGDSIVSTPDYLAASIRELFDPMTDVELWEQLPGWSNGYLWFR